jgi:hypothetical protein
MTVGCAKGGNGGGSGITVAIADSNIGAAGVNLSIPLTATVSPSTANPDVTWSITGTSCTGSGNPCGSFSSTTGTTAIYVAPSAVPSNATVTIKAVSQADNTAIGELSLTVIPVTTTVTPTPVNVGQGLVQQFTAVALPDYAPQTFTWTCTVNGNPGCANFVSSTSSVAVYTAQDAPCANGCVQISAAQATGNPGGCSANGKSCTPAKVSVVAARLTGTYALHFSGYDSSHNPISLAGSVTVTNGAISGVVDVLKSGTYSQSAVTGSYSPSTLTDQNTNNAGTLNLTIGASANQYQVVLDAFGNLLMIESNGQGTGSGAMEKSQSTQFTPAAAQTFVFGFTGTDSTGERIGYAGVLPMDGTGHITGGMVDSNDGGTANSYTGVSGTYQQSSGIWSISFTVGTQPLSLDFYIGSGQSSTKTKTPLTLYAISNSSITSQPTLSGRMVYQDLSVTYDKTALSAPAVSHLTGVDSTGSNTLVSLAGTSATSDGNINGTFDANNAGTIVSAASFACTYTTGTAGRYVVTLLGTGSTTCTGGIAFVLYASGANRGVLLDQSSAAVMAGGMDPQTGNGSFGVSEIPGTYVAASISNATSAVIPLAANLLLTYPSSASSVVGGTQYQYPTPGAQTVTGTYSIMSGGAGTLILTTPAASYVLYAIDASHFEMIDVDKTVTNASVIYAEQ